MPRKQHLFAVTHWLLTAATWLSIFLGAVLLLALGGLFVAATNLDGNHLGIPDVLEEGIARIDALKIGALAVSGALICAVLFFLTFRSATGIVETAISGDPFVIENAKRLRRIGWLLLALNVIGAFAKPMFDHFVPENLRDQVHVNLGFDPSPIGLLAILLIFVLARIFRHGSEMRTELEGTV